jgi:AraC-like DNA-binding protein
MGSRRISFRGDNIRSRLRFKPLKSAPKDGSLGRPRVLSRLDQPEIWRGRAGGLREASESSSATNAGLIGEYVSADLGGLVFYSGPVDANALECVIKPATEGSPDHWCLLLGRSGEAHVDTGHSRIRVGQGDLFLASFDEICRCLVKDFNAVGIFLPRGSVTAVASTLDSASGAIHSGPLAHLLADYMSGLEKRVAGMSEEEMLQAGHATIAMISTCILPLSDSPPENWNAIEAALFDRARSYIQLHLSDPDLSPELLARELRVSRSKLYRAFRHLGGVSRYIQRSRLLAAHAALVSGSYRQVHEVAYSHGFRLASDFARAFRREFGYSPREARGRARGKQIGT